MSSSKHKKDSKKHREEEEKEQRRSDLKSKKTKDIKKKPAKYSSDEERAESPDEHTDLGENEPKKRKALETATLEDEVKQKQAKPNDAPPAPAKIPDAPKQPSATISPQDVAPMSGTMVTGRFGALSKAHVNNQMVVHRGLGAPVCQHYFDDVLSPENIRKLAFSFVKPGDKSMGEGGFKVGFITKKDENDEDEEGIFTDLRFRTCPLEVIDVQVHGVGTMNSNDENSTTGQLPDDSRRKYTIKVRASVTDPDIVALDPSIADKQANFVNTMNGPFMEQIKYLLWMDKNTKSGQKKMIRLKHEEEEKEEEKKRQEEGRLQDLADPIARKAAQKANILSKCIKTFAGGCQNWVFYEKMFKGKMVKGDEPAGSIFRFKHNVFFPIKDQKKNAQPSNAIVTKKATSILQPMNDQNQTIQNAGQADQGQGYRHINQPQQSDKNEAIQQYDQDNFTVIGDMVFKNEYEERAFDFSDTTPAKAWEIYYQYTEVQKTHNYSRITFVDANGAPINLGKDINTRVLKPGDFIELDVKPWVYVLSGGMGVRLDFGTPITIVRQGTSTFGMSNKHVYASNSKISAPIVFGELDTATPSNIQVPPSPASWDNSA